MKLKDKVILITGGSGAIGLETSKLCVLQGAVVISGYLNNQNAIDGVKLDVRNLENIKSVVKHVVEKYGKIDGLVNLAGIHVSGPLTGLNEQEINSQIEVNLTGTIHVTQAVMPYMIRQKSGSIVNISSVSAHRMIRGHSVYSATKAGIEGFTKALASEVAKKSVRVNCVCPGPVWSEMLIGSVEMTGDDPTTRVPMGRLIKASEVAEGICFLLSDESSAITGTVLPIDGGYVLW